MPHTPNLLFKYSIRSLLPDARNSDIFGVDERARTNTQNFRFYYAVVRKEFVEAEAEASTMRSTFVGNSTHKINRN